MERAKGGSEFLNSILLEGIVSAKAELGQAVRDGKVVTLAEWVMRFRRHGEWSSIACRAYGKLADTMLREARAGRAVRIVGYLGTARSAEGSSAYIVAEHVDFNPSAWVVEAAKEGQEVAE